MTQPETAATTANAGAAAQPLSMPAVPASGKNIFRPSSVRLSIINWWHVAMIYVQPIGMALVALGVAVAASRGLLVLSTLSAIWTSVQSHLTAQWALYTLFGVGLGALLLRRRNPVYLVDFATFQPPESWRVTHDDILTILKNVYKFDQDSLDFSRRILARSATGQATNWPPGIHKLKDWDTEANGWPESSYFRTMEMARQESEDVISGCLQRLMDKTGLKAKDIDFLVINCSLFSPTPSLCAMVSNKFHLRSDCKTYNLGGMGCSAGVISIDLAKQLLRNRPNSVAVVISTENLTQQLYLGDKRSMLLQNTLFRCGGAAVMLSSRLKDGFRSKYKLLHTVRYQNAEQDAYECVYETEDENMARGIRLSKQITKIAGQALTKNLTLLGPRVLTIREQAKVVYTLGKRWLYKQLKRSMPKNGSIQRLDVPKPYVPNFKLCIQHFCIHAGGRAVIDGIEENLALEPHHTEASKATLYRYGNTSSSSIWYELEYIENNQNIRRGHRVLQIAFGSGFKCNSAVWLRMR